MNLKTNKGKTPVNTKKYVTNQTKKPEQTPPSPAQLARKDPDANPKFSNKNVKFGVGQVENDNDEQFYTSTYYDNDDSQETRKSQHRIVHEEGGQLSEDQKMRIQGYGYREVPTKKNVIYDSSYRHIDDEERQKPMTQGGKIIDVREGERVVRYSKRASEKESEYRADPSKRVTYHEVASEQRVVENQSERRVIQQSQPQYNIMSQERIVHRDIPAPPPVEKIIYRDIPAPPREEKIVYRDIQAPSPREELIYIDSPAPPPIEKVVYIDKYIQMQYERPMTPPQEEIIKYIDRIIEVDHGRPQTPPRPPPKETIVYVDKYVERQYPRPKTPEQQEIIKYVERVKEVPGPRPPTPPSPPPIEKIVYIDKYVEVDVPAPPPPAQEEVDVYIDRVVEHVPAHSYIVYESDKIYDLETTRIVESSWYYDWWVNGGWKEKWTPGRERDWQAKGEYEKRPELNARKFEIDPNAQVEVLSPNKIRVTSPAKVYRKPGNMNEVTYINEYGMEETVMVQEDEEVVVEQPEPVIITTDEMEGIRNMEESAAKTIQDRWRRNNWFRQLKSQGNTITRAQFDALYDKFTGFLTTMPPGYDFRTMFDIFLNYMEKNTDGDWTYEKDSERRGILNKEIENARMGVDNRQVYGGRFNGVQMGGGPPGVKYYGAPLQSGGWVSNPGHGGFVNGQMRPKTRPYGDERQSAERKSSARQKSSNTNVREWK